MIAGVLDAVEEQDRLLYLETVHAALTASARKYMEALMTTTREPSPLVLALEARGEARGKAMGEVSGRAASVLTLLDVRGVDVPDALRRRITSSTDVDEITRWLRLAATATSADELH